MVRVPVSVAVALAFVAFPGLAPRSSPLVSCSNQETAKPSSRSQIGDADKQFAEITRSGRQSEQVKLLPQMEQFIRDYPTYPQIERVYSQMLIVLTRAKSDPGRLQALADEALAKFPAGQYGRWSAYYAKFSLLERDSAAWQALGEQILKNETNAFVLQSAADMDKSHALPLLEKAIAERPKQPNALGLPSLDELQWAYAKKLAEAGRTDEALKRLTDIVDADTRALTGLQSGQNVAERKAPAGTTSLDARVDAVRERLADRCNELLPLLTKAGRQDLALNYAGVQATAALPLIDRRPELVTGAAQAYEKLGKPDLAIDVLVRSLASRADATTREAIAAVAAKMGKSPDDFYWRAADIRARAAVPAYPFALGTDDGKPMKLADLKAKVILLSFFFPT